MVKALVWQQTHPQEYVAKTPVGYTYTVRKPRSQQNMPKEWETVAVWYLVKGSYSKIWVFKTEHEAKTYAQAHFEDVVKSCMA